MFGAFVPFDERGAETFFGRTEETALLDQLLAGEARVVTFMGASGVGKTSLLRAGLTPALARRGVAAVTLGSYPISTGSWSARPAGSASPPRSPARTPPTTWAAWPARRRGAWS